MFSHVYGHYRSVFGAAAALDFEKRYPLSKILGERRTVPHVLIAMQGFQTGGGEMFPIHLANAISARGYDVSLLIALSTPVNVHMRRLLSPEIPIYTKTFLEGTGVQNFLDELSVDLVHTHNVGIDKWLYWSCPGIRTPYVITHHGSYECEPIPEDFTEWLLAKVDEWVYIADKNLDFADGFARNEQIFTKLPNAMPLMGGELPFSRGELGIEQRAFVFGLASRAMRRKGWDIAIDALTMLRREATRPVHLILCGDGEDLDALKSEYHDNPAVRFLGYQDKIQSFYRLCDCCILPTRFEGESYPLTIIEAILAGVPTIATDVGEVRSMLRIDTQPMGLTVPPHEDDAIFTKSILRAMRRVVDPSIYAGLRASVAKHQGHFSMESLVNDYLTIYQRALSASTHDKPVSQSTTQEGKRRRDA
jgi:glycosyltransferase involved in cell wall biosynthesis